ncbi:MAG: hypothetical protein PHE49_04625 [bacterium]|nr:hypothetical protein [bacterium]
MIKIFFFSLFFQVNSTSLTDRTVAETSSIEAQSNIKGDSLIVKLKNMTPLDTNISKTEGQDSVKDSFTVKSESISTSDSSFYMPKKKEWYDVKESVFGENQVDTTLQDSGTYSEGRIDGTKACKGNEMLVGAAVGGLSSVAGIAGCVQFGVPFGSLLVLSGYIYPFTVVSGKPSEHITNGIKNKGESYKKGFLKEYRYTKKMNAFEGTACGCATVSIVTVGFYVWIISIILKNL